MKTKRKLLEQIDIISLIQKCSVNTIALRYDVSPNTIQVALTRQLSNKTIGFSDDEFTISELQSSDGAWINYEGRKKYREYLTYAGLTPTAIHY